MHLHLGANPSEPYKVSEKQATELICKIQAKGHSQMAYRQLLQKKQQLEKYEAEQFPYESLKILQIKAWKNFANKKQASSRQSQAISSSHKSPNESIQILKCALCFQQLPGKSYQCRICQQTICKNCLARTRQLKNGQLIKFCTLCDTKYIEAILNKQHLKKKSIFVKALQTLIREQEALEMLVDAQKKKVLSDSTPRTQIQEILTNSNKITNLKKQQNRLETQLQEMKVKISWGKNMTKSYQNKNRKLTKFLNRSFGNISNNEDSSTRLHQNSFNNSSSFWQVPVATSQTNLQVQNLNESLIVSMIQTNNQQNNQQKQAQKNADSIQSRYCHSSCSSCQVM